MRALLDTHAFLWWVTEHPSLSPRARDLIGGGASDVYLSAVVAWEIAIKKRLDRLEVPDDLQGFFDHQIKLNDLIVLPVQLTHALRVYDLPDPPGHKDPFDRLLVAQALAEDMALLSADEDARRLRRRADLVGRAVTPPAAAFFPSSPSFFSCPWSPSRRGRRRRGRRLPGRGRARSPAGGGFRP